MGAGMYLRSVCQYKVQKSPLKSPLLPGVLLNTVRLPNMSCANDPLFDAVMHRRMDEVVAIGQQRCGCGMSPKDGFGNTPLDYAIRLEPPDSIMVHMLVYFNVDVNNRAEVHYVAGTTPLMQVVRGKCNKTHLVEQGKLLYTLLLAGAEVNAQDAIGNTSAHYAAFECNRLILQILLHHGALTTIKNNLGYDVATTWNIAKSLRGNH